MNDWRHLLIDAFLDECDCFWREGFRERCVAVREFVQTPGHKLAHLCFRILQWRQSRCNRCSTKPTARSSDSSLTMSPTRRSSSSSTCLSTKCSIASARLFALQHLGDVFGETILKRRNRVENRRACLRRQSIDERRIDTREQIVCVRCRRSLPLCVERNWSRTSASKTVCCETSSLPTALPIDWASFSR